MAARKTPSRGGKPDKLMRDALALELHREETVSGEKMKRLRLVARALVNEGIAGNIAAIKEINERMDGKVSQPIDGDGEGGAIPMSIEVRFIKPDTKVIT